MTTPSRVNKKEIAKLVETASVSDKAADFARAVNKIIKDVEPLLMNAGRCSSFPYMVTAVSSDPALTPTAEYLTQYAKKLIEDLGDQVTKLLEDGCEMGKAATDLGLSLWPVASLAH